MKLLVNPGEEVIIFAPYFPEYLQYIKGGQATVVVADTDSNFDPDFESLSRAITPKTTAVFVNSPNNPTGRIYSREVFRRLGEVLRTHNEGRERPIFLISDEPYRRLLYDDNTQPSILPFYDYTFIVGSFSKDISLPGERIGYLLVHPNIWTAQIHQAITTQTRVGGYVNAPSLMQFCLARCANAMIDLNWYKERRDLFARGLQDAGLECPTPGGAFYLFPKVPEGVTGLEFADILASKCVLVVPGSGFGAPNYIRICYACTLESIQAALPKFREAVEEARALAAKKQADQHA